jgi:hypothetical protein
VRTFTTAAPDGTGGGGDGGGGGGAGPGVDVTAPIARVTPPAPRKRARRSAWRTLRGTVTDAKPSAGIQRVEVAATIRRGSKCRSLGRKGFAAAPCSARTRWLTARVNGLGWQLRLKRLVRGAALFRVRARDNAGNLQKPAFTLKIRLTR